MRGVDKIEQGGTAAPREADDQSSKTRLDTQSAASFYDAGTYGESVIPVAEVGGDDPDSLGVTQVLGEKAAVLALLGLRQCAHQDGDNFEVVPVLCAQGVGKRTIVCAHGSVRVGLAVFSIMWVTGAEPKQSTRSKLYRSLCTSLPG